MKIKMVHGGLNGVRVGGIWTGLLELNKTPKSGVCLSLPGLA